MKRRQRRRAAELLGIALFAVAAGGVAIAAARADDPPPPDADTIYRVELASYDKALAAWRRDSAVVDSVSRTVETDTLYLLYRRLLTAPDLAVVAQEVACEEWRLGRRYHPLPSAAAIRRMLDTLSRPNDTATVRRLRARLAKLGRPRVGHWACGDPGEPRLPAEVGGVSMIARSERPGPPQLPRR